jgi:hypothetical protein
MSKYYAGLFRRFPVAPHRGSSCSSVSKKPPKRHTASKKRQELIVGYAYYRANTAVKDANSTSYTQEIQCLARQLAERMTDEELEAYLKEHEDEN